jgi:hypothetical protein
MAALRTYYSKIMRCDIAIDLGKNESEDAVRKGNQRHFKMATFRSHVYKTADEQMQQGLEKHKDFGKDFWLFGAQEPPVGPGTQYVQGAATTANTADGRPPKVPSPPAAPPAAAAPQEPVLTPLERGALTRANKKMEDGILFDDLTEKEQAAVRKAKGYKQ